MITLFQSIVLGFLQGVTELFPVSSLGHSVLLPGLFGWHIDQNAESFLTFLVATHFATALVLFGIYFKDWMRVIAGMIRSLKEREIKESDPDAKLGWLLVVSSVPVGVLGILFKDQIQAYFISPTSAAVFLILNGFVLFGAEWLRKNAKNAAKAIDASGKEIIENGKVTDARVAGELSWMKAVKIGVLQVIALIPGFSRTGSTISGGLLVGLSHEDAMRYSFLLATPIIGAAALLELPPLLAAGDATVLGITLAGSLAAAIAAYGAVKFLTEYFRTKTLTPFAVYCVVIGVVSLLLLR